MGTLRIEVIRDPESLNAMRTDWNALLKRDSNRTIFQLWEWQSLVWEHMHGEKDRLCILALYRDNRLVGIAPLCLRLIRICCVRMTVLCFLGDRYIDYQQVIADDDFREDVFHSAAAWILGRKDNWDFVQLENMIGNEANQLLMVALEKGEYNFKKLVSGKAPFLTLDRSRSLYDQFYDPGFVRYLKRKKKKMEKDLDVSFNRVKDEKELDGCFRDFVGLNRQRSRDKLQIGIFRQSSIEDMVRALAIALLKAGLLRFYFLHVQGKPAASLFNFAFDGKIYYYQSGFDLSYRKYSVGHLCHLFAIEEAWNEDCSEYDFLAGDETYKWQWTEKFRTLYRIRVVHARWKANLYDFRSQVRSVILRLNVLKKWALKFR